MSEKITLTEEDLKRVKEAVEGIHHGSVEILVNVDNPSKIDLVITARERLRAGKNERFPAPSHLG